MKEENKDRVLKIGVETLKTKGYHQIGLNEVLNEANVPKGSFYYYFKSKEDFVSQVIDDYGDLVETYYTRFLGDESISPKQRFEKLFNDEEKRLKSEQYMIGCVIGDLSNEVAGQMPALQTNMEKWFERWKDLFVKVIKEGQSSGEFSLEYSATELANFFINSRQGALLRMKSNRSIKPYKLFRAMIAATMTK